MFTDLARGTLGSAQRKFIPIEAEFPERTTAAGPPRKPLASKVHLAGFFAIQAGLIAMGFIDPSWYMRLTYSVLNLQACTAVWIHAILYLAMIPFDCALLLYCWIGVRMSGGDLVALSGARWTSWKDLAVDYGDAILFWMVLLAVNQIARQLLGSESVDFSSILPQAAPEIFAWIAVSIAAAFCEEMVFRGYFQQQLHSHTGNLPLAVLAQGVIFGMAHSYQGWKSTIVICFIGILLGMFAALRKNLRSNIILHAWVDMWEGWLKFIV